MSGDPGFDGADPDGMGRLAAALGRAAADLAGCRTAVVAAVAGVGGPDSGVGSLVAVEQWLEQERVDVLRRAIAVQGGTDPVGPFGGLAPYDPANPFGPGHLHPGGPPGLVPPLLPPFGPDPRGPAYDPSWLLGWLLERGHRLLAHPLSDGLEVGYTDMQTLTGDLPQLLQTRGAAGRVSALADQFHQLDLTAVAATRVVRADGSVGQVVSVTSVRGLSGPFDELAGAERALAEARAVEGPLAPFARVAAPVAVVFDLDALSHPGPGVMGRVDQVAAGAGLYADGAAGLLALGVLSALPPGALALGIALAAYQTGRFLYEHRQWITDHMVAPALEMQGRVAGAALEGEGHMLEQAGEGIGQAGRAVQDELGDAGRAVGQEGDALGRIAGPGGAVVGEGAQVAGRGIEAVGEGVGAAAGVAESGLDAAGHALEGVGRDIEANSREMADTARRLARG